MPDASLGALARLSLAPAGTPLAGFSEACEFVSESLRKEQTILETAGLRGSRSHPVDRTRDGTSLVKGDLRLHATPVLLDLLLPRILGSAEVNDQFALAESLPEFDLLLDRIARRFLYQGCRIDRAVFRARAGGLLELVLEIMGRTEQVSSQPFPTIAPPVDAPYAFQDATLTLRGTPRQMLDFELAIDNRLVVRFTNSAVPSDITPGDRVVTLACTLPYTADEIDLYGLNAGSPAAAGLSFTNGGRNLSFTLPAVQFPDRSPVVAGRTEITLSLLGTARRTAGAAELLVINDSSA